MRLPRDQTMMMIATNLAGRSTCARRAVGCVLTNSRGHIIGTGYNGVAAGLPHCIDQPCSGSNEPSGLGLDKCEALHAEQNALLQCRDAWEIDTVYVTVSPCITCTKLFMNTSCQRILFRYPYSHNVDAGRLAKQAGIEWRQL